MRIVSFFKLLLAQYKTTQIYRHLDDSFDDEHLLLKTFILLMKTMIGSAISIMCMSLFFKLVGNMPLPKWIAIGIISILILASAVIIVTAIIIQLKMNKHSLSRKKIEKKTF